MPFRATDKSEIDYSRFFDLTLDFLAVVTIGDGCWQQVNSSLCQALGHDFEELKEKAFRDFVHPDDRKLSDLALQVGSDASYSLHNEYRMMCKNGDCRWIEWQLRPFANEGLLYCTGRDVSDRRHADEALQKRKQRLDLALGAANMGVFEWDLQTGFAVWENLRMYRLFGHPPNSQPPSREAFLDQHLHPDDQAIFLEALDHARQPGSPFRCMARAKALGADHWQWLEFLGKVQHDCQGTPLRLLSVVHDISERHQAEAALRASEERLRLVGKATNDVIWDWDILGNCIEWSEAAVDQFGVTRDELRTSCEQWAARIHPDDRDYVLNDLREALTGSLDSWQAEYRYLVRDNNYATLLDRGIIARDGAGTAYRMIGSMMDMSTHERAAAELRASEERLRVVLDVLPVGIFIADGDGSIVHLNPAALAIWGDRAPSRVLMEPEESYHAHWPESGRPLAAHEWGLYRALVNGETSGPEELVVTTTEDEQCTILNYAMPIRDEQQKIVGGVACNVDISDRKAALQALKQARDELEERVRQRTVQLQQRAEQLSRLASELTLTEQRERRRLAQTLHDHLQQLLVGARFGLELLDRRSDPRQQPQIRQISRLLCDSIDVSRSLTVELSPPILHEAGLAAGLDWLARQMRDKQKLDIDLHLGDRPEGLVEREDVQILLFQSIRELLFNVIKHSGVMEAALELVWLDNGNVRVAVSDNGRGFIAGDLFTRAPDAGGGFGLFSIKERLELQGGRLTVRSKPGEGATFVLLAPIDDTTALRPDVIPARSAIAAASTGSIVLQPELGLYSRVLLADDHSVMRRGLKLLLEGEEDIRVVGEASDGEEACRMAHELQPDIILMDFSMPRMDGVQATRCIHRELPNIRIIGLSMYEEEDRAAAIISAGAVAYVNKSEDPKALLSAIRTACPR